ncbi:MAG: hypothetical protein KJ623_01155 [Nanoarchaeota archaeon]|nr:hypothetical protein [Nanoarchaeota archaeon]MBU0962296.1 hypothetical protein [Nanoarchaeota archaeon]
MKKIVFDTDFLIDSIKFRINIFEEIKRICDFNYELNIIDKTLDEIKNKSRLKLISELLKANNVNIIKTLGNDKVDDLIVKLVDKDYIVATQDQGLKRRLKNKGVLIITIRQKNYLALL